FPYTTLFRSEAGKKLFNAAGEPVQVSGVYPSVPSINQPPLSYTFPTHTVSHTGSRALVPAINFLIGGMSFSNGAGGFFNAHFSYGFQFTALRSVRLRLVFCSGGTGPSPNTGWAGTFPFPIFSILA